MADHHLSVLTNWMQHSENTQRTLREHTENTQRTLRAHSENTQSTLKAHSEPIAVQSNGLVLPIGVCVLPKSGREPEKYHPTLLSIVLNL